MFMNLHYGLLLIVLLIAVSALTAKTSSPTDTFWKDGYCVQKSTSTPEPGAKSIRAKVEGKWQTFPLVSFPEVYWKWNRERRVEYLNIFREMLEKGPKSGKTPQLSGPHNGMVATWGAARKDSAFKLNNAVKGMGFIPKEDKIEEITKLLEDNLEAEMPVKLDILDGLYQKAEDVFSPDRMVSLELYSEPEYNTQTFINQMISPACVTVYLDIPTFKVKQIARLLHPKDPKLTKYETQVVRYVNLIHSFFHGDFSKDFIAVIYYNSEIYDSSPGKKEGKGTKLTP